jgi:hypothetical protein
MTDDNDHIISLVQKDISGLAGYGPGWSTILSSSGGYSSTGVTVNLGSVLQLSSAAACLDRIASDVAKLPIILQKKQGSQYVRVDEHPLLTLLNRPNRSKLAMRCGISLYSATWPSVTATPLLY